jgi:hypothetical protein
MPVHLTANVSACAGSSSITPCAGPPSSVWQYTTGQGWISSSYPCHPQTWAANQWRHVRIAGHTTGNGNVSYDSVTLDGKTTKFFGMYGNCSQSGPWAQGLLSLNFQLDGINNGEKETTIAACTDGFTIDRLVDYGPRRRSPGCQ